MKRTRPVRYVHIGRTTFVKKDIEILQSEFDVREHFFRVSPKLSVVTSLLHQFFWLLWHGSNTGVFVCQFAGYHSLLPGLFGKALGIPVIIVASGTESAKYPSISYGNFSKLFFGFFTAQSFKLASHVVVVHKSLAKSQNTYYSTDGKAQGFLNHVDNLDVEITEIPYGFDFNRWVPVADRRPNSFITVAHVWNRVRFVLKGIDLMLDLADAFPDCEFTIIGMTYTPDRPIPGNVNVFAAVDNDQLAAVYSAHQFYVQLSISEGHPNALCEAMLCGCIPIGSTAGAIPDIIGETGYFVSHRDLDEAKDTLAAAISDKRSDLSEQARNRVKTLFPLGRRRSELNKLVAGYLTR
ncbi:MAG: glycosyltransferase family 4 protein [Rhodothermales bacterium]|nr:glycosyltransferase family 4 protein [Rhodothermales bacterium]